MIYMIFHHSFDSTVTWFTGSVLDHRVEYLGIILMFSLFDSSFDRSQLAATRLVIARDLMRLWVVSYHSQFSESWLLVRLHQPMSINISPKIW